MDVSPFRVGQVVSAEQARELKQRYTERKVQPWKPAPKVTASNGRADEDLLNYVSSCWISNRGYRWWCVSLFVYRSSTGLFTADSSGGTTGELAEVVALAEAGKVKPHIQRFALEEVEAVYRKLQAIEIAGRAVLIP